MTPVMRINLGAPSPIMRIARPGRSADSTDPADFLFREDFLYGQIVARGVLANPGPGGSYTASVNLGVPINANTHVELMRGAGGILIFPIAYDYDETATITVPNFAWSISGPVLTVNFGSGSGNLVSYIVFKV